MFTSGFFSRYLQTDQFENKRIPSGGGGVKSGGRAAHAGRKKTTTAFPCRVSNL